MPSRPLQLLALLAVTASLTACGSDPTPGAGPNAPQDAAGPSAPATSAPAGAVAQPVAILGSVSGANLSGDDYGMKLLEVDRLSGTGLAQAFADSGVTLDPAAHTVVLLALGDQPQGAACEITALQRKGNVLYVQATATPPASNPAGGEVTRPFSAVAIARVPANTVLRSDIK